MRKKQDKYIVYIHEEWVLLQLKKLSINTMIESDRFISGLHRTISDFLNGKTHHCQLITETFTDSQGNKQKAVEIYRLSDMAEVKTLADLNRLRREQRKNGFVELKNK